MKTTYHHDELGEITLFQNGRVTRISLRVLSSGVVRLCFPMRTPLKEALAFLEDKKEWVQKAQSKIVKPQHIIEMPFATRSHSLYLDPQQTLKFGAQITEDKIIFTYPLRLNIADPLVQENLKKTIEHVWRIEAKAYLPERLEYLSQKTGLKYSAVSIRNTHSRWGSCSGKNAISLSLNLMRLPDHLIDYIILHELCHSIHKNHGAEFYLLLDKVCGGNHKKYNAEVKKYSTRW